MRPLELSEQDKEDICSADEAHKETKRNMGIPTDNKVKIRDNKIKEKLGIPVDE